MREAEEVERVGLALAAPGPVGGSVSAELDQARLLWVECERKLRQSLLQVGEEAFGVGTVLEAHNGVVGIAHEDDISARLPLASLIGPQIVHIMEVDVRQQR